MGRVSLPKTFAGKHLLSDVVQIGNHCVRTSTGYLAATEDGSSNVQGKYAGMCDSYSDHQSAAQTGTGSNELTLSPTGRQENVPITGATRAKVGDPVFVTGAYGAQVLTMTPSGVEVGFLLEFRSAADCDLWYFTTNAENSSISYDAVADVGVAADVYAITTIPAINEYKTGQKFIILAPNTDNTGASTLNVCGVGAKNILDGEGNALLAGDIVTTLPMNVVYDGTQFILFNPATKTTWKANEERTVVGLDAGAADAYTVTTDPFYPLADRLHVRIYDPLNDNTGASTLDYNGGGALAIVDGEGSALQPGDIVQTNPMELQYDVTNTRWILQNPATQTTRKANALINLFDVDAGAADAYVAVTDPAPALAAGIRLLLIAPAADSTGGACTMTFNGTADAILVAGGGAPAATAIQTDCPADLYFDGTNWILLNPQA